MPDPPAVAEPRVLPLLARQVAARHLRHRELALVGALALGAVAVAGGVALASALPQALGGLGFSLAAGGLVAVALSLALADGLASLRTLGRGGTGGRRYDQLRDAARLQAGALLLDLLLLVASGLLVGAAAQRLGLLAAGWSADLVGAAAGLLAVVLVLDLSAVHAVALRTPRERASPPLHAGFVVLGLAGTLVLAGVTTVLATRDAVATVGLAFHHTDAPFVLLSGAVLAALTLKASRSLPSLLDLVLQGRSGRASAAHLSRTKSVLLPALVAFALLFVVVLLLLAFGLGLVGMVEEVPRNAFLLGAFGFVSGALVLSVALSVVLSRSVEEAALYRRRRDAEQRRQLALVAGSAAVSLACFGVALLLLLGQSVAGLRHGQWLDFTAFGFLAALGPYGFHVAARHRRIRRLEERFPDFLRDLAASRKAGLTLDASVRTAARGEYGALTPEVVKMADQLSWNVPFDEALQQFAVRVKTPLIQRTVSLITEAGRNGGNVTDVLLAAARDARELKNLENERRSTIGLYTAIVYLTFFVFLAVAAVLYGTFAPEILRTGAAATAAGMGGFGGVRFGALTLADYRQFYFLAALVQGLGNGLVAGLMTSGRVSDGLRHAFVMVLVTYAAFTLLLPRTD